ncbi:MAG TPA: 4Fe-4S binding protein [Chloroflexota bacterium]
MIESDPAPREARGRSNRVEIDLSWCKSCGVCVAFCPTDALTADEVGTPTLSYPEKCTGCGLCEMMCPDFAIEVVKAR